LRSPIYFDTRWNGHHGIGRFSMELERRLPGLVPLRIIGPKLSPIDPIASSLALAGRSKGCYFTPGFNPPLRSPIPFVFVIHDLVHLQVPEESSPLRRLYYSTVVRPASRKAWRILTVSEHSRGEIIKWSGLSPEVVRVVGAGVSPQFVPGPLPAGRLPYLLHVGRRGAHKNIGNLLQGYSMSRASREFELVFTGTADPATIEHARAAGVRDRVRFAGVVDDAALVSLYQRGTALLFPSIQEGFGLPIVEAMASGMPVITSNTTSMPEVAGDGNALLVDPQDPAALAQTIDRLLEEPGLWQQLSNRGLARARSHSWEQVATRVLDALAT
jgi:glycosyltransferase involved in cell wall biosynthesis